MRALALAAALLGLAASGAWACRAHESAGETGPEGAREPDSEAATGAPESGPDPDAAGSPGAGAPAEGDAEDAAPAPGDAADGGEPEGTPGRAECEALFARVVDLAIRREAREAPEIPPPTEDAREALKRELSRDYTRDCATLDRETYICAMAAESAEELGRCEAAGSS